MGNYTSKLTKKDRKKISLLNAIQMRNMTKTKKERKLVLPPSERVERCVHESETHGNGDSNPMMDGISSLDREELNVTIDEKEENVLSLLREKENHR